MCVVAAACGDGRATSVDGGTGHDGGADAPVVLGPCDAPETFADGLAPTRVLHVDANAAAGGDGSAAAPFRTVQDAATVAQPGDAIRLGPGTHTPGQYLDRLRGTAAAPIWIGGEPGQPAPVIQGGAQALHLVQPAYVVVHDLEVTGQTANGINIDDGAAYADETAAHHVALVRLHVHDIGTGGNNDCIKVSGVNDLALYDSIAANCGAGGSGIDHVGCHRSVVARNIFDGAMATAVQAKGGSTDIDIRQNRMGITGSRAVNLGGSTDFEFFRPPLSTSAPNAEARRVRAFNNVVGGLAAGSAPFSFVGCVDCLVAHNAVFGEPRWIIRILQETTTQGAFAFEPASAGRVINNSFAFTAAGLATAVNVGANTSPDTFMFAHNLWYAADDPSMSAPSLPVMEQGSVLGQPPITSGLAPAWDPRAVLTLGLCWESPEYDAAIALPEVAGTFDGMCRPGDRRSIGPWERTCAF